jgi:hypothetical protein
LSSLPQVLATIIALLYATGFLVVSAFLERFGIAETGAEFLKVKYLQVGLLFMLFPCLVVGPIYAMMYLRIAPKLKLRPPTAAIVNIGALLCVCCYLVTFAPLGHFHEKGWWIALLFSWTMLGVAFAGRLALGREPKNKVADAVGQRFDRWCIRHPFWGKYRKELVRGTLFIGSVTFGYKAIGSVAGAGWTLVMIGWITRMVWRHYSDKPVIINILIGLGAIGLAAFALWAFRPNWSLLSRMWFYYAYCILAGYLLWQQWMKIWARLGRRTRPAAWLSVSSITAGLYYMAVHAFAYGVYPLIPAAKGGGDFVDSENVQIVWKASDGIGVPSSFLTKPSHAANGERVSIPLKVVHETPALLFLANPKAGAAARWRLWDTPDILVVRTDTIAQRMILPSSEEE